MDLRAQLLPAETGVVRLCSQQRYGPPLALRRVGDEAARPFLGLCDRAAKLKPILAA
jgi:hypothetical protein